MKKGGVLLLAALLILGACASLLRVPISSSDVPSLKGQWKGTRDMTWAGYRSSDPTVLEIFNDMIPLKGKISILFLDEPQPRVYVFEDGTIDPEGNFRAQMREDIKVDLSLHKGANQMRLDGYYYHAGNKGRLTVDKK